MKALKLLLPAALSAGLILTAAPAAEAQPKQRTVRVAKRLKQARARLLRQKVGLDEAKAVQVEKILDQHAKQRRGLKKQTKQHRRTVMALLSADSGDQQAYARAIKGARDGEKKLRALRDKEFNALAKVLTPKQQAKLMVAVKKMQKDIRRHMQRRRRRRPRR